MRCSLYIEYAEKQNPVDALNLLLNNPAVLLVFTTVLGLLVGSFLNVVIHRLPVMLEAGWRNECQQFLQLAPADAAPAQPFNLVVPHSHCPHCQHRISPLENIPVISYLLLGGKCSQCAAPISVRYPLVEIATALVSGLVAWRLGATAQLPCALVLSWALICLSAIDIDRQLLPDCITLPFMWLGLFISVFGIYVDSHASIIGSIAGYLSLWSVFQGFKLLTGKEGMGYGDFKLLALFGAWLGWQKLLLIVLLSSLVGAAIGILLVVAQKQDRSTPIPFGPFLAAAGWIALLWGDDIVAAYFSASGIR